MDTAQTLSNANIYNPLAFPTSTNTIYTVTISSVNNRCGQSDLTTTNVFHFYL